MIIKNKVTGIMLTSDNYHTLWFYGDHATIEYPDPEDNGESTTWEYIDEDIEIYKELIKQCEIRIKALEEKND